MPLLLKFKLPALAEPTAFGEALQEYPLLPTLSNAPDEVWRNPEAGSISNRLLYDAQRTYPKNGRTLRRIEIFHNRKP